MSHIDPACAMAAGDIPADVGAGTLVAVFASPVAAELLHFGAHVGYRTVLIEPRTEGVPIKSVVGPDTDIVFTDHDRPELGPLMLAALGTDARWIGVMGSVRHAAQHVPALRELGATEAQIARVRRPIGLNIGSKSPAEIAIATLAGLIATRNARPGGFDFDLPSRP